MRFIFESFGARLKNRVINELLNAEFHFFKTIGIRDKIYTIPSGKKMLLQIEKTKKASSRRFGTKEPYTKDLLEKTIKPGMHVFELGAYAGYFTLILSDLVGDEGRVYSFEPTPHHHNIVDYNVKLNNLKNVEVFNLAAGGANCKPIYFSREDRTSYAGISSLTGMNYKGKDNRAPGSDNDLVEVKVISLSQLIRDRGLSVDFLFMDIEGCETLVFEDIKNLIKDGMRFPIYFESHQEFYGMEKLEEIFSDYRSLGYEVTKITANHFLFT